MNCVLLEPHELDDANRAVLADHRARHVREVLRSGSGQTLRVGVLDGPLGIGVIESLDDRQVVLRCELEDETPSRPRVDIMLSMPRPKVLKRLWAPLASMGVGRILLTNAWKVERNYFDTHVLRSDFYRAALIEGLEQARDTRLPVVSVHKQLRVLVENELDFLLPDAVRLLADPGATARVRDVIEQGTEARVIVAVGPEGGWVADELAMLQRNRFTPVGMGPRILRTEAACIAMLSLIHDRLWI
ncbi:MAG: 16S rRNA (uracil(1498)-N(3))-methyltransferase [Deltaproteobacteria bacterium]|nr:16S rRNA (uracil(1498)-N(3))-methyltransferase [Deltaproteobacteria bacterium]